MPSMHRLHNAVYLMGTCYHPAAGEMKELAMEPKAATRAHRISGDEAAVPAGIPATRQIAGRGRPIRSSGIPRLVIGVLLFLGACGVTPPEYPETPHKQEACERQRNRSTAVGNDSSSSMAASTAGPTGGGASSSSEASVGYRYCAKLLEISHRYATGSTISYLIFLCLAVGLGFVATHLRNNESNKGDDPDKKPFVIKYRCTLMFVGAAMAGILAAYLHSRAEAASQTAAAAQQAMARCNDWRSYAICLHAAARWDSSRADSLAAASTAATDKEPSGNEQPRGPGSEGSPRRAKWEKNTKDAVSELRRAMEELDVPQSKRSEFKAALKKANHAIDNMEEISEEKQGATPTTETKTAASQKITGSAEKAGAATVPDKGKSGAKSPAQP